MPDFIPLSVPNLKGNELKYVTEAITSEWVSTAGPFIREFENRIAAYTGASGAVACQNGTSGLHTALALSGITSGDEVIVPTLTFIAAVNPVKYLGAEPVFMDCDDSLSIDAIKLAEFCQQSCDYIAGKLINKLTKRQIKAIVVVHIFGNMANMEGILSVARQYSLKVIEDATEAIGTYYTKGLYAGLYAGTIGDIGVYSFNGNKIMTTGGGGMIVSKDKQILQKARHLTTQAKSDELYYIHDEIGYNYRMTNLQAALGLAQFEQLENFIQTKKRNYDEYKKLIQDISGLSLLSFRQDIRPNYWFYALNIDKSYPLDRDQLIQHLASYHIQSRPIWGLIHEQKPYQRNQAFRIEKASEYQKQIINIPCSSNLSLENVHRVVDHLRIQ